MLFNEKGVGPPSHDRVAEDEPRRPHPFPRHEDEAAQVVKL